MAARKNLGQVLPAAAALTTFYTVPAAVSTVVSSVVVCNQGTTTALFRLSHAVAGAVDAPAQYLAYDIAVDAGQSYVFTIGITMATTDVLRVQANTGLCSFNAYGQES